MNAAWNKKRTPTYLSWASMVQRCTNKRHKNYKNYGGRGITVCDRWRDYGLFLGDMGARPEGKTLDRIDNNGNYEPANCRWATVTEQAVNKRIRNDNSSGYRGVYEDRRPRYKFNRWYSEVRRGGVRKYLGHFSSPEEANEVRLKYLSEVR